MWLYVGLVILRVSWSLSPQTGYIHPDEFFQSVEVIAEDTLNITVEKTWEFEGSTPIRSMAVNKILFSPIFTALYYLSSELNIFHLTGPTVLSSSRAVMTCLSFVLDYHIWKMCKFWNLDAYIGLVLLSGSYVMLTYQTHSFSNSIETVFLLCLFARIVRGTYEPISQGEHQTKRQNRINTNSEINDQVLERKEVAVSKTDYNLRKRNKDNVEKDAYCEMRKIEKHQTDNVNTLSQRLRYTDKKKKGCSMQYHKEIDVKFSDCILLALLNTLGIFNRPTFALFSICPFLWWCYCMRKDFVVLFTRVCQFVICTLCFCLTVCIIDTCFYAKLDFREIFSVEFFTQKLVLTPLNFVRYNTNTTNLESHGRHPFYLHFLVNFPLLFGPLAIKVFWDLCLNTKEICISLKDIIFSQTAHSSDMKVLFSKIPSNQKQLLLICIIIPMTLLSIFSHQEPRFLIPLTPFVILYSMYSFKAFNKAFCFVFILFNIILSIFYGVLHQGGITRCLFKIQEMSSLPEFSQTKTKMLFSHTYMPPKHLLLLNQKSDFSIIDLKGGNSNMVQEAMLNCKQDGGLNRNLYLVIPGTVLQEFIPKLQLISNISVVDQFYWHLSMEDPPTLPYKDFVTFRDQMSLFLLHFS